MQNPLTITEQKWIWLLCGSLFVSLLMFAWLTRKPLCFESEVVRLVHWETHEEGEAVSQDIYRCRARIHIDYHDKIAEQLPSLESRLQLLDIFGKTYLEKIWKDKNVTLRVSETPVIPSSVSRELVISEKDLSVPGLLEARLLSTVIDQHSYRRAPSIELLKTYLGSLGGFSEKAVVESDWKLSLYAEAVKRAGSILGVRQQKLVLDEWLELFEGGRTIAWEIPEQLVSGLNESLALYGYRPGKKLFQIPFAVYFMDSSIELSHREKEQLHRQLSAVVFSDRVMFPFSEREYKRSKLEPIQVGRMVLFQCGVPKMGDLEFTGIEFEHLLFVQSCDRPKVEMMISALRSPKFFAKDYKDTDFVQLHLPSLRMALAKTGESNREIISVLSASSQETLKKTGFLKELVKDDVSGVQSWKGAIEPLPLFRLKSVSSPN